MTVKEQFFTYSEMEFVNELQAILIENNLPISKLRDITVPLQENGFNTMEKIYKIQTNQTNKAILIYSSIDCRTGYTREKGSDAVRVIIWLRTKQGDFFKSYKRHKRINTLFKNLGNSIKDINSQEIKSFKGFKKSLKYA